MDSHCVARDGLELLASSRPPTLAPKVLKLQVCTTAPGHVNLESGQYLHLFTDRETKAQKSNLPMIAMAGQEQSWDLNPDQHIPRVCPLNPFPHFKYIP